MSPTLSLGCLKIATCFYCRGKEGDVEADLGQVAALPPSPRMLDVNLADRHGPRLIVFGRDAKLARPCPHVIDLSVHCHVARAGKRRPILSSFYAQWLHPWLGRHDVDEDLLMFAWDAWESQIDDRFRPGADFSLVKIAGGEEVEFRLDDPPRVMTFGGDLLSAENPVQFLRELRACRRRHLKASA